MDRLEPKRLVRFSALTFFVTLASAVVFCFGCSMHEMDRQGPEDFITFLLAGGTYLSLFLMFAAIGNAGQTKQPPMNRNNGANRGYFAVCRRETASLLGQEQ
jgi:hypothetical protein